MDAGEGVVAVQTHAGEVAPAVSAVRWGDASTTEGDMVSLR